MILGKTLFGMVMKQTFYGHFVAGEDQERIKPTISRMQSFGVKSILDYSVEVDESESKEDKKQFKKVGKISCQTNSTSFATHGYLCNCTSSVWTTSKFIF